MSAPKTNYTIGLPPGSRVLITGGSGFIGTNLVTNYRNAGVHVANVDQAPPRNAADADLWTRADITNDQALRAAMERHRPTHVFHLAARTDLRGKHLSDYGANIAGVQALLSVTRDTAPTVSRVVVTSSRMVCRIGYEPVADDDYCPPNAYGASKVETERLVREADDLPCVLTRPTSIWGPWFGVPYRDFFLSVASGRYVHPAGRKLEKSFGFVGNTTWQLHKLLTAPADEVVGQTFYLADDPPLEVREFADRISAELGRRGPRQVPLPILTILARIGDVVDAAGARAPLTSFRLSNLLTPMIHDLTSLTRVTGEPPYALDEGIALTVKWLREQNLVRPQM